MIEKATVKEYLTIQSNRAKFIPLFVQQAVGQLQSTENQSIEAAQQLATKIPWGHNIFNFSTMPYPNPEKKY